MSSLRTRQAPTSTSARAVALDSLSSVLAEGASLAATLPPRLAGLDDPRERALAQELAYGVLRWRPRLEAVLAGVLDRPLRRREHEVRLALLLGIYQLLHTRVPAYAAVAETLALLEARGKGWAKGLANALLRRVDTERAELLARADASEVARYAHPAWLLQALRRAWPDDWAAILTADNERPPLTLRVNRLRVSREAYLDALGHAGLDAGPTPFAPEGVVVETPVDVESLPGFSAGLCSVQDAAAQLAAPLLGLAPGQRVLDACAAPGGKTAHILETEPELAEVVALEQDPARAERLRGTLARLGLRARVVVADAGHPDGWWDRRAFDRILLDAPCSATGVIRRHPDVKYRRDPAAVTQLARAQRRLIEALWPLLAPAGTLLYATCSVLPEENEEVLARFLDARSDARPVSLEGPWGRPRAIGRQVLPGDDGMDGFFYALLRRGN
jgi:16S rRNA (cytosine967-C5)-methyltransferase